MSYTSLGGGGRGLLVRDCEGRRAGGRPDAVALEDPKGSWTPFMSLVAGGGRDVRVFDRLGGVDSGSGSRKVVGYGVADRRLVVDAGMTGGDWTDAGL